jgi:hypothetical protein
MSKYPDGRTFAQAVAAEDSYMLEIPRKPSNTTFWQPQTFGIAEAITQWMHVSFGRHRRPRPRPDYVIARRVLKGSKIGFMILDESIHVPLQGLCPICGEQTLLCPGLTDNGRLIGSCFDAFPLEQWLSIGEYRTEEKSK